jgi:hypothetical protein
LKKKSFISPSYHFYSASVSLLKAIQRSAFGVHP